MKCQERYIQNTNLNDWIQDDVEHETRTVHDLGTAYEQCVYCGGKIYPKNDWGQGEVYGW